MINRLSRCGTVFTNSLFALLPLLLVSLSTSTMGQPADKVRTCIFFCGLGLQEIMHVPCSSEVTWSSRGVDIHVCQIVGFSELTGSLWDEHEVTKRTVWYMFLSGITRIRGSFLETTATWHFPFLLPFLPKRLTFENYVLKSHGTVNFKL